MSVEDQISDSDNTYLLNGLESVAIPIAFGTGINARAKSPATTVTYEGNLYVCVKTHRTTATFDTSKWLKIVSKGVAAADAVVSTISGTTGTITPSDAGSFIVTTSDSAVTITLDDGTLDDTKTVAIPLRQLGAGTVSFVPGTGVTIESFAGYSTTGGQGALVTLQFYQNVWYIGGEGA